MSITHEEARRLIQFKADDALRGIDITSLEAHLSTCLECQKYAASLQELESALPLLLHRRWSQSPLPLSTGKALSRKPIRWKQDLFFATRIMAMGLLCVAFLFNIWRFTQSGGQGTNPPPAQITMIPTPSAQSAVTKVQDQKCEPFLYEVRKNDTLESIAKQYSITMDQIQRENQLSTTGLTQNMKLSIPGCSPTPSGTPNSSTTIFTSLPGTTTLTPMDSPTQ